MTEGSTAAGVPQQPAADGPQESHRNSDGSHTAKLAALAGANSSPRTPDGSAGGHQERSKAPVTPDSAGDAVSSGGSGGPLSRSTNGNVFFPHVEPGTSAASSGAGASVKGGGREAALDGGSLSTLQETQPAACSDAQLHALVRLLQERVAALECKTVSVPEAVVSTPPPLGAARHTAAVRDSAYGTSLAALFSSPTATTPSATATAIPSIAATGHPPVPRGLPPGVTPLVGINSPQAGGASGHGPSPTNERGRSPRRQRNLPTTPNGNRQWQHQQQQADADGAAPAASVEGSCASPQQSTTGSTLEFSRMSLMDYMRVEIFGADDHGSVDTQVNRTVKNFLSVPRQLERLLFFGLLICLDTFLYIPTFLPLRILGGVALVVRRVATRSWHGRLSWPILYDCMRGAMMAQCLWLLQSVQMSRVYHYIRGQSMIKLYVLIGMVEIFDKLMCSFGQDALDSLYWSTMRSKKRVTVLNFAIVCVQSTLHSLLLFVHITTLTVAVNSSDQALLTLLISNNFAEIKSSVFKKFDKQNLFQLSCHDIVERFKLILFLGMIMLLNISHGGDEHLLAQFLNIFFLVFGGEVLADWIKHAFITKFNLLQPSLYEEYSMILARDITSCRKDDDSILDHTHLVARRLAFATLPLNCVMIRFLQIAAPRLRSYLPGVTPPRLALIGVLFYLIALAAKLLTGMLLMAHSYALQCGTTRVTGGSPLPRSPAPGGHKTRKELSLEKLSGIARFTLWRGRIV